MFWQSEPWIDQITTMDNYKSNGTSMAEFDDAELEELYNWVDSIPLSRPKKNIARDFSDGGKKQRTILKWIWFICV